MQIPLRTRSTVEAYIANREWRDAHLSACPLHASGGCSFSRHGSYARVAPQGLRIARWYCPEGRQTFSLLPDFLAARLPGLLDTIQTCVAVVQSARSMEAAADLVRGPEVTLAGAIRWLRRRVQAIRTGIAAVAGTAGRHRHWPNWLSSRTAPIAPDDGFNLRSRAARIRGAQSNRQCARSTRGGA